MVPVPKPARRPKGRPKDRVPAEVAQEVLRRDGYQCIAPILGIATECASATGGPPDRTLDHVHPRGFAFRGLSVASNLVTLCGRHHRDKTENGRFWREKIDQYLAWVRPQGATDVPMG